MVAGLIPAACWISAASLITLHSSLISAFRVVPILVSHENGSQQTRVSSLAGMELNQACNIHSGHPSRYWPQSLALNQPTMPVLQPPLHISLALGQYLIKAQWRKLEL